MDRREFLRRLVIVSVLGATAATGIVGLGEKLAPNQTSSVPTLLLNPPTTSQETTTSDSATTIDSTTSGSSSKASTSQSSETTKKSTISTRSTTSSSTSTKSSTSSTQSVPSGYIFLAPLSAVSGKSYAYFNHPKFGSSILINYNGTWKAFSASCTHAGCTVNLSSNSLYCPCHAGYFSANNGAVTGGPPPTALAEYDVKLISGNLYVGQSRIN